MNKTTLVIIVLCIVNIILLLEANLFITEIKELKNDNILLRNQLIIDQEFQNRINNLQNGINGDMLEALKLIK